MRIGSKLKNYLKNSSLNDSGKIFICVCLIICITINFLKVNSFGKDLDLKSKSAVLIDGNTGRILYGKNENEKMPMASTTKIMTCIVALESGKMNQIIKVSSKAASMPKVKMYAKKGEQYYLKDLLYAMMLESFNDAAMIVAEGIGGSQEEFAKMMNKKAKIVIIGAGSAIFTKTILCDLLHFDDIDVENISLVDINEEKLQVVKKMTEKMLSQVGWNT